jgi:hypothetical protein
MARRRQVVEMIGMETNRFRQACNPRVQRTIKATLKTLEAQLVDSNEGGHLFQSDRGHHSNLMAATLVSSRGPILVMSWRPSLGQAFAHGLG